MSLITRCPICGTTFRVQPAQLAARGGKVRCGKCRTVFNGVAALLPGERNPARNEPSPQLGLFEEARLASASRAVQPEIERLANTSSPENRALRDEGAADSLKTVSTVRRHEPNVNPTGNQRTAAHKQVSAEDAVAREEVGHPTASARIIVESVEPEPMGPGAATTLPSEPALSGWNAGAAHSTAAASTRPESAAAAAAPLDFLSPRPSRTRRHVAWSLAVLLAVAALGVQLVLLYRAEILARFPQSRSALAVLCARVGYALHLPRRPDLLSIEASNLRADAQHKGVIAVNAIIRNRASFAQEYPSLELTLTDDQARAIVRRVLSPAAYLVGENAAALLKHGIAPHAEADIHLYFDASRIHATGYRLYLFYP